jgi:hypothetical protein
MFSAQSAREKLRARMAPGAAVAAVRVLQGQGALVLRTALVALVACILKYALGSYRARSPVSERRASLSRTISELRREAERVNNPSTFAAFAKLQRRISKLEEERDALGAEESTSQSMRACSGALLRWASARAASARRPCADAPRRVATCSSAASTPCGVSCTGVTPC